MFFTRVFFVLLLTFPTWAAQDEFFRDSEEFLESQLSQQEEPNYLGYRIGIGPKLMIIRNKVEPVFSFYYLHDLSPELSIGTQLSSWVVDPTNYYAGLKLGLGQSYASWGSFSLGLWWFNENLESTIFTQRLESARESEDWALSVGYAKEIIPWRGFEYFPRFELELGYRKQEFYREAELGQTKRAHLWISTHFSVSLFIPAE